MSRKPSSALEIIGELPERSPLRWPVAELVLEDGTTYVGRSFGAPVSMAGEVVFSTGMVGYPEALTDPSYQGQILVLTYPLIGNYGVPSVEQDEFGLTKYFESQGGRIHVSGLVVSEYCEEPHHFEMYQTLRDWLVSQGIPAIMRVDTRNIVVKLRDAGCTLGKIVHAGCDVPLIDPNTRNLVREVSSRVPLVFGKGDTVVLALDMGIKLNTIRCFLRKGIQLRLVPYDWDIRQERYDALFISNGPGDPSLYVETIRSVEWALKQKKPIFGICLGNQILCHAAGGKTYKLKYGNRGQNQPCRSHVDGRVVITTQNHGFAVDMASLNPLYWEAFFTNTNDGTNEGIRHKSKPFSAVQFHPEAKCGPQDSEYLFEDFMETIRKSKIEHYVNSRPKKVLVLGAGPIQIAQAGEFDYSGSQCLKSLREEKIKTVLINPNIATVQTQHTMADAVYLTPLDVESVERVIAKERPDGIMLGWGGQTALNCGVSLSKLGVLEKYGVRVLGTPISAIEITEDREMFKVAMQEIGEKVAESEACTTGDAAATAALKIGYPVMVRAAFTLGGMGSGVVTDEAALRAKCAIAFASSPQVLVEKSLQGWKEIEYEVVRDIYDNCVTICNMENLDPMGVHTGESIVVAPSQTLSNDEYQMLRTTAVNVIRHLGVIGECNIQFGLDPNSHQYYIIEVNARLSRSSALASKATGYPLAHVAAKLALGVRLPDVVNAVTKTTSACFEPSLDYVVVKAPRWDLDKFSMANHEIGTMMKSVGEVMAIGRTFCEAFQKALRMTDVMARGFMAPQWKRGADGTEEDDWPNYLDEIVRPTPRRVFAIAKAFQNGFTVRQIHDMSKIDLFFLNKLQDMSHLHEFIVRNYSQRFKEMPNEVLLEAKQMGFGDRHLALALGCNQHDLRRHRIAARILPYVKQIDTVAGEFPAQANYLYLSYNAADNDVTFEERMVIVVGSGVYRIGNSVEFDFSCVVVASELRRRGYKVLMVNYNPETVSTDYDECDRLYFDEISEEVLIDITERERPIGVVLCAGGQLAQRVSVGLKINQLPVWGTDPKSIDVAENRESFSMLCDSLAIVQPEWTVVVNEAASKEFARRVGYPIVVRPSYVLSGSAMAVIWNDADIAQFLQAAAKVSGKHPVVLSKFHKGLEYDIDVVAFRGTVLCLAISEHLEPAGVHSGDATMFLPPQRLTAAAEDVMIKQVTQLCEALCVTGPMNVQFLWVPSDNGPGRIMVIEANVRCSRSVPFVSKTLGISFPALIVDAITALHEERPAGYLAPVYADLHDWRRGLSFVACKAAMFSFSRLAGSDPILGVEMRSTGEVGVIGRGAYEAFLNALTSCHIKLPRPNGSKSTGILIAIDTLDDAVLFAPFAVKLAKLYEIYVTASCSTVLFGAGIRAKVLHSPKEKSFEPNVATFFKTGRITLTIQLRDKSRDFHLRRIATRVLHQGSRVSPTDPSGLNDPTDDYVIRRLAVDAQCPLFTELSMASFFADAMTAVAPRLKADDCLYDVDALTDYVPAHTVVNTAVAAPPRKP